VTLCSPRHRLCSASTATEIRGSGERLCLSLQVNVVRACGLSSPWAPWEITVGSSDSVTFACSLSL
jgi:hypothetical protein